MCISSQRLHSHKTFCLELPPLAANAQEVYLVFKMLIFKENISLKEFTTMKTGGNARYFFIANNTEILKEAIIFAKEKKKNFFILGGGSNIIISDLGFDGVVIKMEISGVVFEKIDNKKERVIAGAGVVWDRLISKTVDKNLYGLENLSLIPGTVGAAPVQNIGAYGVEVGDLIEWVEVLNTETMKTSKMTNEECLFGYRNSFFKSKEGKKFVILNVAFSLKRNGKLNTQYKDIEDYFEDLSMDVGKKIKPTLKTLPTVIIGIRINKLPDTRKTGTAGSFFKNPIISERKKEELLKKYQDIKYFPAESGVVKLSVAWLIDNIGDWKGVCIKNACVYEKHSLVIVNKGKSTTKEIIFLANKIKNNIKEKTGIELEFEVNIIGDFKN